MKDFIYIGCTPSEETCFPAGHPQARAEAALYKRMLESLYPAPANCYFSVKGQPHDFGTYYEVVAVYDDEDEVGLEWALQAESGADYWTGEFAEQAAKLRTLEPA